MDGPHGNNVLGTDSRRRCSVVGENVPSVADNAIPALLLYSSGCLRSPEPASRRSVRLRKLTRHNEGLVLAIFIEPHFRGAGRVGDSALRAVDEKELEVGGNERRRPGTRTR
ncbi:hypothetical protein B0H17DRAFT_1071275 [Mycena rosella]|uniref:Uncharacterized protein n=1 Tax=Mycena rosella TaxID=1033263 RepID=A0AAD7GGE4_MYCRO|nr:hypothetical protein B0H17DRAFT_1071275 [Mycena rosella]